MQAKKKISRGGPLSQQDREQLREIIERDGDRAAAERLGVGYSTVLRALAGLPLKTATETALRLSLAAEASAKVSEAA